MASVLESSLSALRPETRAASLRSSFTWTLAGNIVYSACQWGMISALAKLGNAALVGSFALGLAITAPIFMFTNFQLRGVQATDAHSQFDFADYFTLRLMTTFAGLLLVGCVALAGRFDPVTAAVILLVGVSKAIESLSDVVAGLLQKMERLDRVAISLMMRGVGSLVAFGLVFWNTRSLPSAACALVVAWAAVFVFYDVYQMRECAPGMHQFPGLRWIHLKRLARLSMPLGIVMTMLSLNVNIPRFILQHYGGAEEVGIFSSLAYLLVSVNLVANAMGQSAMTRLAGLFSAKQFPAFSQLLLRLSGLGALILFAGVPISFGCGRTLLTLLYRPAYGEHTRTLAILVACAALGGVNYFVTCGLTAARSYRTQVPVILFSTITVAFSGSFLVPRFQMDGAALSLLLSSIVLLIGNSCALRGRLHAVRSFPSGTGSEAPSEA